MGNKYTTVLSIAGSDSIGGAGIQADIKTCCSLGVYAMTAITAITAQNTVGVRDFEVVSADMLDGQLRAVVDDVRPDAVKVGMLPDAVSVRIVSEWIASNKIKNVVVDPVMVATSGDSLIKDGTVECMKKYLFPLATLITPNLPEAEILTGRKVTTRKEIIEAGGELLHIAPNVLIKGGHIGNTESISDFLFTSESEWTIYNHQRIVTKNTHGTGCSLSTAIACFLAQDNDITDSVTLAIEWLLHAIQTGKDFDFGSGHGPVNHLGLNK